MKKDFKKLRKDFFVVMGLTTMLWLIIYKVITLVWR